MFMGLTCSGHRCIVL